MTEKTVTDDADTIVTSSITEAAGGDASDAQTHDDQRWLETVIASLPGRSSAARQALAKALEDGDDGAGPLLGLESTNTENKQKNSGKNEDSNSSVMLSPLLGTNYLKSLDKLSASRSPERVCNASLLRPEAQSSELSVGKTVTNGSRACSQKRNNFPKALKSECSSRIEVIKINI